MSQGSWIAWKDKLLFWTVTGAILLLVGWGWWMTQESITHPSRAEVILMIESSTPYTRDKQMIFKSLSYSGETMSELRKVIERNTEAINNLRVELAKIGR